MEEGGTASLGRVFFQGPILPQLGPFVLAVAFFQGCVGPDSSGLDGGSQSQEKHWMTKRKVTMRLSLTLFSPPPSLFFQTKSEFTVEFSVSDHQGVSVPRGPIAL